MGYRFESGERIDDAARRVADEEIAAALATLDDLDRLGIVESVHDVRKRCKKLRALARLVRPALGSDYQRANGHFRDLSRGLSAVRDAHAILETFDHLVEANRHQAPEGFPSVRAELVARSEAASHAITAGDEHLTTATRRLREGRLIVGLWDFGDDVAVVAEGSGLTYRRARRALARVATEPDDEVLHEWRKRVKYLWYHARLLELAAPSVLVPGAERLKDLSDAIGDDHDLAVLAGWVRDEPDEFGPDEERRTLDLVVAHQRVDLQRRARRLGARLLAEETDAFVARLTGHMRAWRHEGDELACGKIAALGAG